ncbi:MAG: hypothetical protein H7Z13_01820 [Ferruginibacter sp.]|nr:hypothetical protein [Ferruginibacter sp.]
MKKKFFANKLIYLGTCLLFFNQIARAQTDMDAIMMGKNRFCIGPMYSYSSWKNYWEGSLKRDNQNLGTVSTQMFGLMGNYGISSKLNVLFSVPYVKTRATAGTLHSMQGLQDLSLFVKWMPVEKEMMGGVFSLYGIAGVSFPLTDYVADFLPLSIGLHSKTASARVMADYQAGSFFVTGSATYVLRDNIKIDRTSYYTTQLHLTNEVEIPNGGNFNFRTGFRNERLIAEAIVNNWTTFGGFDITRNNMPFPGNKMNATTVGVNLKYVVLPKKHEVSLVAGGNTTVAGRNMGQSATVYGSVFYVLDFTRKTKSSDQPAKTN